MLGAKTRKVTTYGRHGRNHRILSASEDIQNMPSLSPDPVLPLELLTPSIRRKWQERHGKAVLRSPVLFKKTPLTPFRKTLASKALLDSPTRTPLALKTTNVPQPSSSAVAGSSTTLFACPPSILKQNPLSPRPRPKVYSRRKKIVPDSDEEDVIVKPRPRKKRVVVSDSEEDEPSPSGLTDFVPQHSKDVPLPNDGPASARPRTGHVVPPRNVEVPLQALPVKMDRTPAAPRRRAPMKARKATPIRAVYRTPRKRDVHTIQTTPTPSDTFSQMSPSDLSLAMALLSVTPKAAPTSYALQFDDRISASSPCPLAVEDDPVPGFLQPLLEFCKQTRPIAFERFLADFATTQPSGCYSKIGEASYSEVFAIGEVVLKIVPLRDENDAHRTKTNTDDLPSESDASDVLREIIVTTAMGDLCAGGFIQLHKSFVVQGSYPHSLLELWDGYNSERKSESFRPDRFPASQNYAIIVLSNGGSDLESYSFKAKTGWREACSIFWQVATTLATAEDLVQFEHRDLHWGQVLVKAHHRLPMPPKTTSDGRVALNEPSYGVSVTIIDLGLARMDAGDGSNAGAHWTAFEDVIFDGEGDYQFDIYRMMRTHNGNVWDDFRPLTNVMWLHYLAVKLLRHKRLRAPAPSKSRAGEEMFVERECYECLKVVEKALDLCMSSTKRSKKGKREEDVPLKSAGDVVTWGASQRWLAGLDF